MKNIRISRLILIILLLAFFALVVILLITGNRGTKKTETKVTAPERAVPSGVVKAPTPYLILPTGKQEYDIQGKPLKGDAAGSKITTDPLVSTKGASQTFSIALEHTIPITAVSLELTTDNQTKTYPMKLTTGTDKKGTWSVTWVTSDTTDQTYYAKFIVVDNIKHQTVIKFPIR